MLDFNRFIYLMHYILNKWIISGYEHHFLLHAILYAYLRMENKMLSYNSEIANLNNLHHWEIFSIYKM